ncbi:MAG: helix-turn-helix domain-containing protein [Thermosediminibacteraceae bacterium]|nr:helix-turn-helix domain-containing protein [Thermosediminibacteraceae bacterium]
MSFLSDIENGRSNPSLERLKEIAEALDTTVSYLLGENDKTDDPTHPEKNIDDTSDIDICLTKNDEKDIAKDLEKIMSDLEHSKGLMFFNEPLTYEDKLILREAIEFGIRIVKQRNKEKYTPKKYRKK